MSKSCKACKNLEERKVKVDCFEVDDKVCKSLGEDKGFNGKTNDCQDMHDLNDCLMGRAKDQITIQDDCDWKGYMTKLIPTLYNLIKMLICSICGLWIYVKNLKRRLDCVVEFLKNQNKFTRIVYNNSRTSAYDDDAAFYRPFLSDYDISIYMDSTTGVDGIVDDKKRKVADQDYHVTIYGCMDGNSMLNGESNIQVITPYRSTEAFNEGIEIDRGRHFESSAPETAMPVSTSILIRKGEYIKLRVSGKFGGGTFRLHQIQTVWNPVSNAGTLPDCLD